MQGSGGFKDRRITSSFTDMRFDLRVSVEPGLCKQVGALYWALGINFLPCPGGM